MTKIRTFARKLEQNPFMAAAADSTFLRAKPNYFYSVISVAMVLFTLGFFGLVVLNAQLLVKSLKERVNLTVELLPTATPQLADGIVKQLEQSDYVRKGSVEYISKETAAAILREDFGEDFLKLDLPNPLFDVVTFNVQASFMEVDSLKQITAAIEQDTIVADVFYQESLVDDIAKNIQSVSWVAAGVLLLFALIAIILIHNTVRLALYANRFLVKNMQLVGASWEFISKPYLRRAVRHGLLSGMIASVALFMLYLWIQSDVPGLRGMISWEVLGALFGCLFLLGALINGTSTYYVVRKYLKMRVDDLY
jgi:cell division transport system permease protein